MVYNIKRDRFGNIDKYKCRLVAKGFKQIAGRDYDEVFAPTAQQASLRILIAVTAAVGLDLDQIDVKTAFLNGDLEEEVYLKLPAEFGGKTWRLRKALYGLKQAARAWHNKQRESMLKVGFKPSPHDLCLFVLGNGDSRVYMLIHVDDALIVIPMFGVRFVTGLSMMLFLRVTRSLWRLQRRRLLTVSKSRTWVQQSTFWVLRLYVILTSQFPYHKGSTHARYLCDSGWRIVSHRARRLKLG